jgi:hypothetical protein
MEKTEPRSMYSITVKISCDALSRFAPLPHTRQDIR